MPDKADLLAQFERKRPEARVSQAPEPAPGEYLAFKAVDRPQHRLRVRLVRQPWERLTYAYLLRMVEDEAGTDLALIFSFAVVIIRGRNLRLLADAIDGELCEWMQEFDAAKWNKPTDAGAAFIESIEIHVETKAEASNRMFADGTAEGEKT